MKVTSITAFLGFGLFAISAIGATIPTVDTSCDPTIDPPSSGGCTWYNFYESMTTSMPYGGSSFSGYYVQAPTAPWTLPDTTDYFTLRVLDGGHQGDTFDVYDNGVLLGMTSSTPIDGTHSCANDPTGMVAAPGSDPTACWADPLMSQGTFTLDPNAGGHSINIVWDQKVPDGDSSLQWFEINLAQAPTNVPEPVSTALVGSGLAGFALMRRVLARRRARNRD